MKNIKHIIFSLMTLAFAGCQSENIDDIINANDFDASKGITTITAGFDTDVETRVAIDGTTITWTETDIVYVAELDEENGTFSELMEFEIISSTISDDGKSASFESVDNDNQLYVDKTYAVVSGRGVTINSSGYISISGTPDAQSASDNDEHIEDIWFMSGELQLSDDGTASAELSNMISIVKLDMTLSDDVTDSYHLKNVNFAASVDCFSLNWILHYSNSTLSSASYTSNVSSSVTVDISGSPEISSTINYVVYIPIFNISAIDSNFTVTVETTEDVNLYAEFSAQTLYSGKLYTKEIDLEPAAEGWYLADFSRYNYPDGDIWYVLDTDTTADDDSDFSGLEYALRYCGRTVSVEFPNLKTLVDKAFYQCYYLTDISLPKATNIGTGSLYNCYKLENISLPVAEYIGTSAFTGCDALTAIDLPEVTTIESGTGVYSGHGAFAGCDALKTVSIPKIQNIGDYTFYDCDALTDVSLPEVTVIGNYAFYGNDALASISLSSVVEIGEKAFYQCAKLSSVNFPKITNVGEYTFYNCDELKSVSLDAIKTISSSAFNGCDALTSINFPNATNIGSYAFSGCSELTSISLPSATNIESYAFNNCDALPTLYLPSVTHIGSRAFSSCDVLSYINLPSVVSLGDYSFSSCGELLTASISATSSIELFSSSVFSNHILMTLSAGGTWAQYVSESVNAEGVNCYYLCCPPYYLYVIFKQIN